MIIMAWSTSTYPERSAIILFFSMEDQRQKTDRKFRKILV